MNQHTLVLMGRATRDAEVLESKSGKEYAKFGFAVNEYRGPEREEATYFYEIVSFSKQPRALARKVQRGDILLVAGKPEINTYQSKGGETKVSVSVLANHLTLYGVPAFARRRNDSESAETDSTKEEVEGSED